MRPRAPRGEKLGSRAAPNCTVFAGADLAAWVGVRNVAIALLAVLLAREVHAGALDKFEQPHKPPPAPAPSEPEPEKKKSHGHHGSPTWNSGSSGSSSEGADGTAYGYVLCTLVLPVLGACLAPRQRALVDPYQAPLPSYGPPGPLPEVRLRHYETDIGGFVAKNEGVFARSLAVRAFPGPFAIMASWDRLYETPKPGELARLDLVRFGVSSNTLARLGPQVEFYPWIGALLMQGTVRTWAFDLGGELRVYPISPFSLRASTFASIFRYGPTLFDTKLEVGVSFDRFELHGGLRWLTQANAQGFAGPTAGMTIRL